MSRDCEVECAIAVMAKASIPGRAKTRLAPPLSYDEAAEFNTSFLHDIAQNLLMASRHAPIRPFMAYAPAGTRQFFEDNLPAGIGLLETVAPDFGQCLFKAASALLDSGYQSVCLLNSDSPTLPCGYLIAAATVLAAEGDRMVIGPSTDGGYYLLGLKKQHRRLFEEVDWSTDRVFGQTVARAGEIGLPVVVLPTWYDIDDAAALCTLAEEVLDGLPFLLFGEPTPASFSRQTLIRFMQTSDLRARLGLDPAAERVA